MVHIPPHQRPSPKPLSTLGIVNKLNDISLDYGCSVDEIQKALDILRVIKEKEKE